jgi:hypothetical protein
MGEKNKTLDWKPIILVIIVCVMMILPALPSMGGISNANLIASQSETSKKLKTNQTSTVSNACVAYFKGTISANDCRDGEVPLPAATWLFVLALVAFVGLSNKKKV